MFTSSTLFQLNHSQRKEVPSFLKMKSDRNLTTEKSNLQIPSINKSRENQMQVNVENFRNIFITFT